jgi:glycosyltransferase involved in cell wall biosynthesis
MIHDVLGGRHWLDRWAARTTPDMVIANSHYTAGPAAKLFAPSPVEVCYLPVAASPSRLRRGDSARVVILQASRLERWKGQAVLLEALAMLKGVPGWEAWIAGGAQKPGETEFENELKAFAHQHDIADRVRFLGQRSDVPELMGSADIYCQPNTGPEPFGVALIEAMYAGLPVVAAACGGPFETVTDECGFLAPSGNAGAVAEALGKMIANPELRAKLGAAGRARAAELCDPARQMNRLADLTLGTAAYARDG